MTRAIVPRPLRPLPQPRQHLQPAIAVRRRFVITSHSRPDGDAIGSSLAMAFALRALGKDGEAILSGNVDKLLKQPPKAA